jgi:AraC-like DNA-binding protein
MTNAFREGWFGPLAPNPSLLPPAKNGYRRSLYPGRGVSVYCDRHPPNEWDEHWHAQDQIAGLLDDVECIIKVKSSEGEWSIFHVQGPAVWVIPAGISHTLVNPSEADMVTLYGERTFVRETLKRHTTEFVIMPLSQLTSRDEVIGQLSKAFRRLCRGEEQANPLYVEAIGTVLGTHILQAMFAPAVREDLIGGLPEGALRRVCSHINEHLSEALSLGTLANAAGYQSTSYFGKLFKKSFGLTPHDYLIRRRVARAQELLETTNLKAVEIAHECGFSDDTMMARWFRRVSDRLPSDIRP